MQDPIQNRIEGIPRPSLTAAGLFVLLAALGQWATSALELALPGASVALLIALYYVPFVGVPLLLYARRRPGLGEAMRLDAPPALPMLTVALLALMSVYVASALSALWGAGLDALGLKSPGSLPPPQNERELIASILLSAALPAVAEEMLFRGVVLSAWESRGTFFAIGVSSALFALLHANLYGLPAFLLVGAVAGFAAWALRSVYAAIAYHTIYNAACLAIPYLLGQRGEMDAGAALSGSMMLSLALETAMLMGMMAVLLSSLWLRARARGVDPIPRIRRPLAYGERLAQWSAVLVMIASIVIVQVMANR